MKVSTKWLQKYFPTRSEGAVGTPVLSGVGVESALPDTRTLSDALTFHAFEIDGVEKTANDEVLDVKVTPNRGHDCLSHRGIAKELSAILQIPLASDPLAGKPDLSKKTDAVAVSIKSPLCMRYVAGYIRGVKVGPSPSWLKERLEAIGQRSINNVVDATNFIMFNVGQPLHAFDANKLTTNDKQQTIIHVRNARKGEKMTALDGVKYDLSESMLVIADGNADEAVGIAGVKGGMPAAITEETKDIIIESANFDGVSTRKTAAALKLRTDASQRFEQVISPELAAYGMRSAIDLILKIAGGELEGFADAYPKPQEKKTAEVSVSRVNAVLGTKLSEKAVADAFTRLGLSFEKSGENFTVSAPFERLDISIPEDLIEEVARIVGYDAIPPVELPALSQKPALNKNFYRSEKIREFLVERGFSEVYTSVFADKGERVVLNKVDGVRPYLRSNLLDGLMDALQKNIRNKELLGLKQVRLFEMGAVWKNGKEETAVELAVEKIKGGKTAEDFKRELDAYLADVPSESASYEKLPLSETVRYLPFSKYPFIVRDIALWAEGADEAQLKRDIENEAGNLCTNIRLFDRFEKGGKTSLAYRLIFQSFDRTLEDREANEAMEKVYSALRAKGLEIR